MFIRMAKLSSCVRIPVMAGELAKALVGHRQKLNMTA
jgi:hypothetical protein